MNLIRETVGVTFKNSFKKSSFSLISGVNNEELKLITFLEKSLFNAGRNTFTSGLLLDSSRINLLDYSCTNGHPPLLVIISSNSAIQHQLKVFHSVMLLILFRHAECIIVFHSFPPFPFLPCCAILPSSCGGKEFHLRR